MGFCQRFRKSNQIETTVYKTLTCLVNSAKSCKKYKDEFPIFIGKI